MGTTMDTDEVVGMATRTDVAGVGVPSPSNVSSLASRSSSSDGAASCASASSGSFAPCRTYTYASCASQVLLFVLTVARLMQLHLDLALRFSAIRDVDDVGQAVPAGCLPRPRCPVPDHLRPHHTIRSWLRGPKLGEFIFL